ncbi:ABC transporter ATP-binding protein [Brachybacterium alimentarium]|uniref:ABC transporter ATP-binding protein n=1 Tax=Brachybacterium alimentarium TaxID=47845 RepID=UPI000DF463CF|nr:ABC transporter ATP-binding protein [Brachybacterium alimentarium]RCS78624.1 ABC transporter ATP-binding protein [Brachybacterium alimentarium]
MTDDILASPALRADGLTHSYGPVRALDGLTLTARRGEVTALLGPNGAGKTTAVSCATGLLRPSGGSLEVLGRDSWNAGPEHRARVGVMIQDGGLASGSRSMQLLRYGASLHAHPLDVDEVAEHLGIDEFAGTLVRRLSGGQRQRLALALAIIGRPELVFLDEPTAGMDPSIRQRVRHLVRSLADTGSAVVLTTHMMDDVVGLADAVCVIAGGRTVAAGSVEDVITAHRRQKGAVDVRAVAHGVDPAAVPALQADLEAVVEKHGGRLEITGAGAADLEAVLLELMDGANTSANSSAPTADTTTATTAAEGRAR